LESPLDRLHYGLVALALASVLLDIFAVGFFLHVTLLAAGFLRTNTSVSGAFFVATLWAAVRLATRRDTNGAVFTADLALSLEALVGTVFEVATI
jgi:hypothetical protein